MRYIFELSLGAGFPRLTTHNEINFNVRRDAEQRAFDLAKHFDCPVIAYDADTGLTQFTVEVKKTPKIKEVTP